MTGFETHMTYEKQNEEKTKRERRVDVKKREERRKRIE
jgi:hypothetical protein